LNRAPLWELWQSWHGCFFPFRFACSHVSADTAPTFPVQQAAPFLPLSILIYGLFAA
jgi:hypothetical protein